MVDKKIKILEKDFSNLSAFPGLEGNPFDIILRKMALIQKIPSPVFLLMILLLSLIPGMFDIISGLFLLSFIMGDWIMMEQLPIRRLSFGPPKPATLQLALLRLLFMFLPYPASLLAQICGTFLVIYGFWIEPHHLRITHQEISTPKLKVGENIRFLHLSDLHFEQQSNREKSIIKFVESNELDAILFSGDILNLSYVDNRNAWEEARVFLNDLGNKHELYFVSGSPAVDKPEHLSEILNQLPVIRLENECRNISGKYGGNFNLIGLSCSHQPHHDAPKLSQIVKKCQNGKFQILLYHSPDLAPQAAEWGVDLYLSGHTHGGQVCIPFFGPIFTGSLYGRVLDSGLKQIGNMKLYISRGIGMEGAGAPRVRFMCPPEIIVWNIKGIGKDERE